MIKLDMDFSLVNLCVEIALWSRKRKMFINIPAVFDTGATITHIDTNLLKRLGYDLSDVGNSYVNALGSKNIPINNMVLDNIKLGDIELGAVWVNFSDMSDINSSIILGLNVIKEFNINLDFENKLISMNPNFDINFKTSIEDFDKNYSRFGMWTITKPINTEIDDTMVRTFMAEQIKTKDIELAKKLFAKNMSIKEILELATELTETELKDIQKTINK
jgi:hypothetical protein